MTSVVVVRPDWRFEPAATRQSNNSNASDRASSNIGWIFVQFKNMTDDTGSRLLTDKSAFILDSKFKDQSKSGFAFAGSQRLFKPTFSMQQRGINSPDPGSLPTITVYCCIASVIDNHKTVVIAILLYKAKSLAGQFNLGIL